MEIAAKYINYRLRGMGFQLKKKCFGLLSPLRSVTGLNWRVKKKKCSVPSHQFSRIFEFTISHLDVFGRSNIEPGAIFKISDPLVAEKLSKSPVVDIS